ncbi:MAG: hypothetical protein A2X82_19565 [Geobacteraceae bacterium GWC2_55_20]|nr:MAG: hypothetical protein A2X82_19565 [Geobacteraceae bacterium GWC2_55_20]OGU23114.1 MAG: hypothetical protein A2X85_10815 [Geobacteraceae bacterium GWF2_54_21]HCE66029.1 hypothetical protein [Geobacter sp.]
MEPRIECAVAVKLLFTNGRTTTEIIKVKATDPAGAIRLACGIARSMHCDAIEDLTPTFIGVTEPIPEPV